MATERKALHPTGDPNQHPQDRVAQTARGIPLQLRRQTAGPQTGQAQAHAEDSATPSRDALKTYMNEIGRFPLLQSGELETLVEKIANSKIENKRPESERNAQIVLEGKKAKMRLTEANLRLVVHVAMRFTKNPEQILDYIQAGNEGLMYAVDTYNITKGKFSTHAVWKIKQYIHRARENEDRLIRIPVYMLENFESYARAHKTLESELGHEPSLSELATKMELSEEEVAEIKKYYERKTLSLDKPFSEDTDVGLREILQDPNPETDELVITGELTEVMRRQLSTLPPREQQVLILRFGLDNDGKGMALEGIGKILGVTRERVRQLEERALRRLRFSSQVRRLREDYGS